MKKKWWLLIIIFLLCFNNGYVLAGDAYYSVCTNREPQDALLIGEVVKKENDDVLNIKILRVICGELKKTQIKYYNPIAAKNTSVGKYVLLSVEKENDIYKKCYSVCHEVTIKEVDKISDIIPLDQEQNEDWEISLQWFCNTGTAIVDATDSGKYYEEIDGVISQTLVYDINTHKWYKDPLSTEYLSPNTQKLERNNYVILGVLLVIAVIFLIGLGVWLYKQNKKNT